MADSDEDKPLASADKPSATNDKWIEFRTPIKKGNRIPISHFSAGPTTYCADNTLSTVRSRPTKAAYMKRQMTRQIDSRCVSSPDAPRGIQKVRFPFGALLRRCPRLPPVMSQSAT